MAKRIMFTVGTILTILIAIGVITIAKSPSLPKDPKKSTLITFFTNNQSIFENIATTLKTIKQDVSFNVSDGKDIDSIGRIITNDGVKQYKVSEKIKGDLQKVIYRYGFESVYIEFNWIYFDKAVDFQWHKALIYSTDGTKPPQREMQEFEEIGNGWYYYVGK